jgi:flagellin
MSVINTNLSALNAARSLDISQEMLSNSINRLSSGSKLVNPADDPAGLAVSEKLGAQNGRISAALTNVQNAVSFVQTSDGFLSGMSTILTRLSELSTMAQDPTKSPADIALYQTEFSALQDQLRSTIGGTSAQIGGTADITAPLGSYNGLDLFGSTASGGQVVTIGQAIGQQMTINDTNLRSGAIGSLITQDNTGTYNLSINSGATANDLTNAIQQIAAQRASLGASESRLNFVAATLQVESQNIGSAISSIKDVDVAQESTQNAKYNILVQANTAMLAQANQDPKSVLQLLQK